MILPTLKSKLISQKVSPMLGGINLSEGAENCVIDAANLIFDGGCKTRKPRKAELILGFKPHQKVVIGDFLYLRHNNTLYKLTTDSDGHFKAVLMQFQLTDYADPPDRIIMDIEGELCILPDGIRLKPTGTPWLSVGAGSSKAALFPFTDSRTLFYTNGNNGQVRCDDAVMFKVGSVVRFSWDLNTLYTVVKIEKTASLTTDGTYVLEGRSITLDQPVNRWNNIPDGAGIEIKDPEVAPLIRPLCLGINRTVGFSGSSVYYSLFKNSYKYITDTDSFIKPGQRVKISGSSVEENNKIATVTEIVEGFIFFDTDFKPVSEAAGSEIKITPIIPTFDEAIYYDGRVIGADNEGRSLWISAEGKPFFFFRGITDKKDSACFYCEDSVTSIKVFKGSIICFLKKGGFRILGDNALNFSKSALSVTGISQGQKASIAELSDNLIYSSALGVMEFSSGRDNKISSPLNAVPNITEAAAAGGLYYGLTNHCIYIYSPFKKRWWKEDNIAVTGIFALKGEIYFISDNVILSAKGENISLDWELTLSLLGGEDFGEVIPQKLFCRLKSPTVAKAGFYIFSPEDSYEQKLTEEQILGERVLEIPIKRQKYRKIYLKLKGKGQAEILDLALQYRRI